MNLNNVKATYNQTKELCKKAKATCDNAKAKYSAVLAHMSGTAAAMTAAGADGPTTLLVSGGLGVIATGVVVVLSGRSDDDGEGGPAALAPATA